MQRQDLLNLLFIIDIYCLKKTGIVKSTNIIEYIKSILAPLYNLENKSIQYRLYLSTI